MINNRYIPADQLVLQDAAVREVDPVALVGDDDDGAAEGDALPEPDVARDGEVVEFEDVRDALEPLLEVANLLKRVPELDDGRLGEEPVRVHHQLAVLERVEVRGDEEQIGAGFDLEEGR